MQAFRQSTAFTKRYGPFLDDTDGSPETALSIVRADVQISKAGGAFGQKTDTGGGTHDADAWYEIDLDAVDFDTLGTIDIQIAMAGVIPVFFHGMVMPQQAYDSFYGTDKLHVDMREIDGNAQAATNLREAAKAIIIGVAVAGTLTSEEMTTNLIEATTDHFKDRTMFWFTGVLAGQESPITAYTGTGGKVTYNTTKTAEAPSAGDGFVIA